MSRVIIRNWKILGIGRGTTTAADAEKHLNEIGFPNARIIALENDQASDDRLLELLKQGDWEGISIGGGINGYCDTYPRNRPTLHWFNRLVNLVKENAPQAKIIFVVDPDDLADGFERVLGSKDKPPETA